MTTIRTLHQLAACLATLLVATAVPASELLSPAHCQAGLDRCINEIRTRLDSDAPLHHTVTDVARERQWYVFSVETRTTAGADAIPAAATVCRAHRFDDTLQMAQWQQPDSARPSLARHR